jgi:hypothetical protein
VPILEKLWADPSSLGDETGRTHRFPTKSLILRAKAHDLSHLQIISALPAVNASKGQMQAVSAKSGAVHPHQIDRTNMGLPFPFSLRRRLLFSFLFSGTEFPYQS